MRTLTGSMASFLIMNVLVLACASQSVAQVPSTNMNAEARRLSTLLIKNAIISVNQGNLTGNYTVLRDLASPGFRERNSASDLGSIFGNLREKKLDLSPIVLLEPVITLAKFSKEQQQLRLTGYFPSEPLQIKFDLIFQQANPGGWMIHGLSIGTAAAEAQTTDEVEVPVTSPSVAADEQLKVRAANTGNAPVAPASRVAPASGGPVPLRGKR